MLKTGARVVKHKFLWCLLAKYFPGKKENAMQKRRILCLALIGFLVLLVFKLPFGFCQENSPPESVSPEKEMLARIEELTGAKGEYVLTDGIYRLGFPRSDLALNIQGVKMVPAMGLEVEAAFKVSGDQATVMADLAMVEDQVNLVLDVALKNNLEVTAIHNQFFWDSPKIMFMHIGGHGDLEKLATAVGKVFTKIQDTAGGKGDRPYADIDPAKTTLAPRKIEEILGVMGKMSNGVYKITIGRTTSMHGEEMGNDMGVNTWAAFAGSDDSAVVDGDFAMLESEVQPVLKALRAYDINIVALHNHMLMESPRMIFLHYWGVGTTTKLALALKEALAAQQAQ
jgi:hypothetical protein